MVRDLYKNVPIWPETMFIDQENGTRGDIVPTTWNLRIQALNDKKQWLWTYEICFSRLFKEGGITFSVFEWNDETCEWQDTFHRFFSLDGALQYCGVRSIPGLFDKWEAYTLMEKMIHEKQ